MQDQRKGAVCVRYKGVRYSTMYYYVHCTHDDLEGEEQRDENPHVVTADYDFERPPLCRNVWRQMLEIALSDNGELWKQTGINGFSELIRIPSLKFNAANLYDTMHACLLNCAKDKVK